MLRLALFCLLLGGFLTPVFSAQWFISPDGLDTQAGTREAPFATLEKARDTARQWRKEHPQEPLTITFLPGQYCLGKRVSFTQPDSGTPEAPLRIEAEIPGKTVLSGSIAVPNWKKVPFRGRNDVWEADLAPLGVKQKIHQLFLHGTRQIWARYPNWDARYPFSGGWAYVDGEIIGMYKEVEGERCDQVRLKAEDYRNWVNPQEGEICIFPRYNWWNRVEKIASADPEEKMLTLTRPMPYAARAADRYCVMGFREELDAPGEWYQDVENQKLYFIPPEGVTFPASETVSGVTIPIASGMLYFERTENVVLRGLDLCAAESFGVQMRNCRNIVVEKCLIHDMVFFLGAGVSIHGGKDCTVRGCDFWNLGSHGIEVFGGDYAKMEKMNHNLENNYIHHCGQMNRHGIAITLGALGVRVAHNLIHDTPRCAIFYGGNLHTIEYNRIRFTNLEMEDTAAIYGGGWTGGNSVIRYNHITDTIGFGHKMGTYQFFMFAWGIYIDEAGGGNDVYGNFVQHAQAGAMHLHCGRENHIYNNIFVNNAGKNGKSFQFSFQGWNNDPQGYFVARRQPTILKEYEKRMQQNPRWAEYRGMKTSPANPFLPDGTVMRGNRLERNIFYFPDQPESTYMRSICNLEYNHVDHNLVWNGGKAPIKTDRTGTPKFLADVTEKIPNIDFSRQNTEEAMVRNGNKTIAEGWTWYHKTYPDMKAEIVSWDGKNALRLPGCFNEEKKYVKYTCVRSTPFTLEPGKNYRLSFRLRHENATGDLQVRFVAENQGLWKAYGLKNFRRQFDMSDCGTVLTPYECSTLFRFPAPGEKDYDERATSLTLHISFQSREGWAEVGDMKLEEVEMITGWEGWQHSGADVHSIVADPCFVDAANGDYRLRENSPAFPLGFEPLPFEKMGPMESDCRITWPIVEAEGVRENPQWLTIPPENE
ncbi:MAG: right-handed parallel beta-helix repeat-containing protein [Planctomycetia bacterium]|nr:right-handed parallel beta-helix repeat-containing protein [Planctomycetia bacterium]